MNIVFASVAPVVEGPRGPTSDLASMRYRVILPAQQLSRLGHAVRIAALTPNGFPPGIAEAPCDVLVVSKSLDAGSVPLARAMKARGARVVVDICDDHFANAEYG